MNRPLVVCLTTEELTDPHLDSRKVFCTECHKDLWMADNMRERLAENGHILEDVDPMCTDCAMPHLKTALKDPENFLTDKSVSRELNKRVVQAMIKTVETGEDLKSMLIKAIKTPIR